MSAPPKEKPPEKNLGGREKTVPGGSGKTNNNASSSSPQAAIPEYAASWHAFVTWATGQQFAPTHHMVRIILAELEEKAEAA